MKRTVLYLFFALLFLSCSKDNRWACFKPNGAEISQLRQTEAFTKVEAYNKITVNIFSGSERKVEVVAGKHIISNIKARVVNGVLKLEDENTCNFVRGYKHTIKVNVTLPYLEKVTNNGVGPMTVDAGFNQDSLSIRAESSGDVFINGTYRSITTSSHGNGDIHISGTTKDLYVYANGINFLFALDLRVTGYIFIASLSLGDCNINTTGTPLVQYDISESGNIKYRGAPGNINGTVRAGAKGRAIQLD